MNFYLYFFREILLSMYIFSYIERIHFSFDRHVSHSSACPRVSVGNAEDSSWRAGQLPWTDVRDHICRGMGRTSEDLQDLHGHLCETLSGRREHYLECRRMYGLRSVQLLACHPRPLNTTANNYCCPKVALSN